MEEFRRPQKGSSLLQFPSDYVCLDLETTGLNPMWDEIIEISAVMVKGGQRAETFSTLVKPSYPIPAFVTSLTGISNEMVADAPAIHQVLGPLKEFIGGYVIVGHNVSFDVNFLYDNMEAVGLGPFSNDYVDTMRLGRRLMPEMDHHRLFDLSCACGVSNDQAHRAESDCLCTIGIFEKLREIYTSRTWDEDPLCTKRRNNSGIRISEIRTDCTEFNPDSPVYGKVFVFTGELKRFTRRDAMQAVVDRGGVVKGGITKKTNYLVQGGFDHVDVGEDGESTKQQKAREYMLAGCDIHVISEDVFLDMLEE